MRVGLSQLSPSLRDLFTRASRLHSLNKGAHHYLAIATPIELVSSSHSSSSTSSSADGISNTKDGRRGIFPPPPYVYTWGSNAFQQCGSNNNISLFPQDDEDILSPMYLPMPLLSDFIRTKDKRTLSKKAMGNVQVVDAVVGNWHNVVWIRYNTGDEADTSTKDALVTWGAGVLGHGTEEYDGRPRVIDNFPPAGNQIVSIHAKDQYTIIMTRDETKTCMWFWGYIRGVERNNAWKKFLKPTLVSEWPRDENMTVQCERGWFSVNGTVYGNTNASTEDDLYAPRYVEQPASKQFPPPFNR